MTKDGLRRAINATKRDMISARNLAKKAFNYFGLRVSQEVAPAMQDSRPRFVSRPFASYEIEGRFLELITADGDFRVTRMSSGVTTVVDTTNQGHWSLTLAEPIMHFGVTGIIDGANEGVNIYPKVEGLCAPSDDAQVLARIFKKIAVFQHRVVCAISDGNGRSLISWQQIGLDGIRSVCDMFEGFSEDRDKIVRLANSRFSPFDPPPFGRRFDPPPFDTKHHFEMLYVPKWRQSVLLDIWRTQLVGFKDEL